MAEEKVWTERLRVSGEALVDKTKELLHEGNVRRIILKNAEGQTVVELPLTFGILGAKDQIRSRLCGHRSFEPLRRLDPSPPRPR